MKFIWVCVLGWSDHELLDEICWRVLKEIHFQVLGRFDWICVFIFLAGTPYAGGMFFLDITFPSDYPFKPPRVMLRSNDSPNNYNLATIYVLKLDGLLFSSNEIMMHLKKHKSWVFLTVMHAEPSRSSSVCYLSSRKGNSSLSFLDHLQLVVLFFRSLSLSLNAIQSEVSASVDYMVLPGLWQVFALLASSNYLNGEKLSW